MSELVERRKGEICQRGARNLDEVKFLIETDDVHPRQWDELNAEEKVGYVVGQTRDKETADRLCSAVMSKIRGDAEPTDWDEVAKLESGIDQSLTRARPLLADLISEEPQLRGRETAVSGVVDKIKSLYNETIQWEQTLAR